MQSAIDEKQDIQQSTHSTADINRLLSSSSDEEELPFFDIHEIPVIDEDVFYDMEPIPELFFNEVENKEDKDEGMEQIIRLSSEETRSNQLLFNISMALLSAYFVASFSLNQGTTIATSRDDSNFSIWSAFGLMFAASIGLSAEEIVKNVYRFGEAVVDFFSCQLPSVDSFYHFLVSSGVTVSSAFSDFAQTRYTTAMTARLRGFSSQWGNVLGWLIGLGNAGAIVLTEGGELHDVAQRHAGGHSLWRHMSPFGNSLHAIMSVLFLNDAFGNSMQDIVALREVFEITELNSCVSYLATTASFINGIPDFLFNFGYCSTRVHHFSEVIARIRENRATNQDYFDLAVLVPSFAIACGFAYLDYSSNFNTLFLFLNNMFFSHSSSGVTFLSDIFRYTLALSEFFSLMGQLTCFKDQRKPEYSPSFFGNVPSSDLERPLLDSAESEESEVKINLQSSSP